MAFYEIGYGTAFRFAGAKIPAFLDSRLGVFGPLAGIGQAGKGLGDLWRSLDADADGEGGRAVLCDVLSKCSHDELPFPEWHKSGTRTALLGFGYLL